MEEESGTCMRLAACGVGVSDIYEYVDDMNEAT
jgi:hypothetical protein